MKADCGSGKLTVKGNVDPTWLREKVESKTKKKVVLVSPQPKKDGGGGGGGGDKKSDEKKPAEKKAEEKKPEDKKPKEVISLFSHVLLSSFLPLNYRVSN